MIDLYALLQPTVAYVAVWLVAADEILDPDRPFLRGAANAAAGVTQGFSVGASGSRTAVNDGIGLIEPAACRVPVRC